MRAAEYVRVYRVGRSVRNAVKIRRKSSPPGRRMTSITVQAVDVVTDCCNDIGAGERGRGGLFWVRHLLQRQSNVLFGKQNN